MSHTQPLSGPSVSQVPNITKDFFFEDMSGYQDWICRNQHSKDDRCCTKAQRDYYQECADLGNDVHALREAFLRGETFEEGVPEYQAAVFEPIARFYKESGYTPIRVPDSDETCRLGIELQMTGKEFSGTLDGAGTFAKPFWENQRKTFWANNSDMRPLLRDVWIEDLKIKSKLDPLHPLQLYGYSLLLNEIYGIRADWGLIIRREKKLDKKPELQLKGYYLPAYAEAWNASIYMWRFLNE
jgi:hypothetical protein